MRIRLFIKKYAYIIAAVLFAVAVVAGGIIEIKNTEDNVVINEICTSNVRCCEDENGNFPDWVEIYNPTSRDIDLSGYILNDSADLRKEKFVIPEGTVLAPGAFYLFDPKFLISSDGTTVNLLDNRNHYLDRVEVPELKYDTTYGRIGDGTEEWSIKEPPPGYSNTDGAELAPVAAGTVVSSHPSGFYDEEFDLRLTSSELGRTVYYTVDGSDPVKEGVEYTGPIHIYDRSGDENKYCTIPDVSLEYVEGRESVPSFPVDKCTVIKAVSKDRLGRYSEPSIYTYFVGFDNKGAYDNMAVVSLVADPFDLFSDENGIMVLGDKYKQYVADGSPDDYEGDKANFHPRGRRSERDVHIEIFNEDHESVLDKKAGIRIKGLSSRWDVQKSFAVVFRRAYNGFYKESFTIDGTEYDVHSFALDKCGQDVGTKMRDTIMEECMSGTDCATTSRVPCCVFLNGEYWGFYWIADRFDNSFIADKYGVDINDVEYKNVTEFTEGEWNNDDFDRKTLIDCYAANIIIARSRSWPNFNYRVWRTSKDEGTKFGDGKYRPVIFDTNSASMEEADFDLYAKMMESFYPFMDIATNDETFKQELVDRVDSMCANEFEKHKILNRIDELYDRIHDQMLLDRMRYFNCSKEEAQRNFDESVGVLKDFFNKRYDYLQIYKEEFLNGK